MRTLALSHNTSGLIFPSLSDILFSDTECPNTLYAAFPNFTDNGSHYSIEIQMHGLEKKDISAQIQNGHLNINYIKEHKRKQNKSEYFCSQSYSSSYALPRDADENSIKIKLRKGLLKVQINKIEKTKEKYIEINSSSNAKDQTSKISLHKRLYMNIKNIFAK